MVSIIVYFSGLKDIFKNDLSSYWGYLNYRFNGSLPVYEDLTFLTRYIQMYTKDNNEFIEMLFSRADVNFFKFIFDREESYVYKNSHINFKLGLRSYYSKFGDVIPLKKGKVMAFGRVFDIYTARLFNDGKINLCDVDSIRFSKSTTPEILKKLNFNKDGKRLDYLEKLENYYWCNKCGAKRLLRFIWNPRMYLMRHYKPELMAKNDFAYKPQKDFLMSKNRFAYKSQKDVIKGWLKSK